MAPARGRPGLECGACKWPPCGPSARPSAPASAWPARKQTSAYADLQTVYSHRLHSSTHHWDPVAHQTARLHTCGHVSVGHGCFGSGGGSGRIGGAAGSGVTSN
eukprot:scaffold4613_cov129-Isochrysis_galbana.AAC.35